MKRRSSLLVDEASGCPIRLRHLDDVIENDLTHVQRKAHEEALRYENLAADEFKAVDRLLQGGVNLDNLPCREPKVVRMYVCSSGQDFKSERNYLFENVYPLVRKCCRESHGVDFQLVDLCWGDTSMPCTDPHKMAVAYKELRHCQEVSMGPNFVLFIGQKYGRTHLPVELNTDEMGRIKATLEKFGEDVSLLDTWYKEDKGDVPNKYRLVDTGVKGVSKEFCNAYEELVQLFQRGSANDSILEAKYSSSDFENLVRAGILDQKREDRDDNCIVYVRNVKNIEDHLSAKNAATFVDLDPDSNTWIPEKKNAVTSLQDWVEKSIKRDNLMKTEIALNGGSLDEKQSDKYVSDIGCHFYSTVTRMINETMSKRSDIYKDPLVHEVILHWHLANTFVGPYIAREEILDAIKGYLLNETDQPLVFYGESGSGKSSLIAKAASDINEAVSNRDISMPTALVVRFVGETGSSEDIQPFLFNLCHQLAYITRRYRQDIPSDYSSLKNYFIDLVQRGEFGGMLVILIDSVDRISTTDNGHRLEWLPSRLAANVKVVITINSENDEMMQRLENKIEKGFINMPDCSSTDCENIVKMLLSEGETKHTVSYDEWKHIKHSLAAAPSPLYARLVYEQTISKWRPFEEIQKEGLEKSIEEHVARLFEALERRHGSKFVSNVLGYLTAVKGGLSESELDDILSLDEKVLNDIYVRHNEYPHTRRIPPICWSRLRQDLQPYLVQRNTDATVTVTWRYRTFHDVAKERYLSDFDAKTVTLYTNMADYYLGTWDGTKKKSFRHPTVLMAKYKLVDRDGESCRQMPSQPYSYGGSSGFNCRKLNLLPPILLHSQKFDELKFEVFCNYEWLYSKLRRYSVQRTIADFEIFEDRETKLVADALRMSKSALLLNPDALGIELTGRLLPHAHKYPYIKKLIRDCDLNAQRCCPLVPNTQIYSAPGGPLQYECDVSDGVKCSVNIGVFSSPDGILLTAKPAYSNRLRVWELSRGDERPDIMLPPGDIRPTKDGRLLNIFVDNKTLKSYKSDCGVLHGEIQYSGGKIADVDVSNKYLAVVMEKGAGPVVFDLERSEVLHKFMYHTHAVAFSEDENYIAFNAERNILLYELPTMQRRCVATATDVPHDIIFINGVPKCFVLTKTKLVETIQFDVINRKFKNKTILTDMEAKECIPSNSKELMILRSSKTLHVIDTLLDKVRTRFQKLPAGVFVDNNSEFSGAGFTPDDQMVVAARYTYLIIWDATTCAPVRVLQSAVSPVMRLFTSDSVNKVVTLLENSSFQVWDLDNLDRDTDHAAEAHQGSVQTIAVTSCIDYILSHDNKTPDAKLISLANGKVADTLLHSDNACDRIVDVLVSPDGMFAVTRARIENLNSFEEAIFEPLTDDIMWEVETASKVFHAMSNRYIVFSPGSEVAAFVTCSFYSRCDWTENIYSVFIVHPESAANYTVDFPYHTEFVAPPRIVCAADDNYFVAVVQTCRKTMNNHTKKEISRRNEVRLIIQKMSAARDPKDHVVLRVQNLCTDVCDSDEFLDIISAGENKILAVYAKDIGCYEFVTDKGIIPPKNIRKGAILVDVEKQEALQHITSFLDASSSIKGLQISSQFTFILDSDLKLFKYDGSHTSYQRQIEACSFLPGSVRLALDGRYIIGITENRRNIAIVRTSDDKKLGAVFVHGRANCLEVSDDERTVLVGCEDGRIMIMSLILELADPLREFIEKMPSRCDDDFEGNLIVSDVRRLSLSTPDQHRLSARLRKSASKDRQPPPYTTLQRAVTVSRMSSRSRPGSSCAQQ